MTARPRGLQAAIVRFSIRYRGVVIALACLLLGYGIYVTLHATYDVFPEFAPPQVSIQTEAPGLAAEQVEVLVTQPIENTISGLAGVKMLRSTSIQGLSLITVTFDPASDVFHGRQAVAERLATAGGRLPAGVQPPVITPLTSSASIVLVAGLTSKDRSLMELRTSAEWVIRPRLLAAPGVAKVAIFGGEAKSIQVQVHPDQLVRFGLGMNEVLAAARRATGVRGAGFVDTANQRIVLQSDGQALTGRELGATVIVSKGASSVTLAQIADVVIAPQPPAGAASINGRQGVVFDISGQYGANTLETTRQVESVLEELRPALKREGIDLHAGLFRPASFIETATGNVRASLVLGGVLVILVLFVFLFDVRSAAISCAAIPLSLLAAVIVLQKSGVTLNTMTLGGFAIAIGVVVDDAVVDVENILRRLRENLRLPQPRPVMRVVLAACMEVRGAIVYATFAVVLVVLPIIALSGIAGRLFAPLGIAYALAALASLLVALTVTPALSMMLLTGKHLKASEPPVMRWSRNRYEQLLKEVIGHPRSTIGAALALTLAGMAVLPFFGGTFVPELKEGHYIVHMSAAPGTSLAESLRLGERVTEALRALPPVRSVAQRAGRAELADDTYGTHYSELEVDLNALNGEEAEAAERDIRRALRGIPGAAFSMNTFLTERIEETLSGYTAPVVVNVFGSDLDLLDRHAYEVAQVLRRVPGASDVVIQSPAGIPQLKIRLRHVDLVRWGMDAVDVLEAIRTAYGGDTVGQVYEGNRVFPVLALLSPAARADVARVAALPLRTPGGAYVRLGQLADVYEGSGRYQVQHQGAQRLQAVTANVVGRDVASFVEEAKARIASGVSLPSGVYLSFAGTAQEQSRSQRDLLVNSVIAAVGIVLLLSVVTGSRNNLLLVLANLPFAFAGGALAVFATGGLLSLGSMVGFVTLFGITLRNSILLISHYEQLVTVERNEWGLETAIRGAADRLTPIAMTSIVTALGVLPLAMGMNEPGREIEGPLAVVILGGLATSMALNLLVLPVLALRYARFHTVQP